MLSGLTPGKQYTLYKASGTGQGMLRADGPWRASAACGPVQLLVPAPRGHCCAAARRATGAVESRASRSMPEHVLPAPAPLQFTNLDAVPVLPTDKINPAAAAW